MSEIIIVLEKSWASMLKTSGYKKSVKAAVLTLNVPHKQEIITGERLLPHVPAHPSFLLLTFSSRSNLYFRL